MAPREALPDRGRRHGRRQRPTVPWGGASPLGAIGASTSGGHRAIGWGSRARWAGAKAEPSKDKDNVPDGEPRSEQTQHPLLIRPDTGFQGTVCVRGDLEWPEVSVRGERETPPPYLPRHGRGVNPSTW